MFVNGLLLGRRASYKIRGAEEARILNLDLCVYGGFCWRGEDRISASLFSWNKLYYNKSVVEDSGQTVDNQVDCWNRRTSTYSSER